jgi:DNA-binding transcriptional MerR regulator
VTRPGGLMPIGGLARLSRLTVKALRLYDAEGLLVPAWVDPDSGYRYYRADQVRTATTIALLRSLDVPLAVIREVLEAPDPDALTAVLEAERERAARDLAAREQALRSIERLIRSPATVSYDVTIAPQRARRLVGLTAPATTERIGPDTAALCARVAALLGDGEITALYPLDLEETFVLTAGIAGARAAPGTEEHELPAGDWASTLHVGPYEELPVAYAALLEHLRAHGHEPVAPIAETYVTDPTEVPPAELVTRVAVATAPGGGGGPG